MTGYRLTNGDLGNPPGTITLVVWAGGAVPPGTPAVPPPRSPDPAGRRQLRVRARRSSRGLEELRRRQVYDAYAEAAGDPAFLKDMGAVTEAYDPSAGEGL